MVDEPEKKDTGAWNTVYMSDAQRMINESNKYSRIQGIPRRYRLQPPKEHFIIVHVEVYALSMMREGSVAQRLAKVS